MPEAAAKPEAGANMRLHAVVEGRVQNVGFRATTHHEALRLNLAGWVRNRHEGKVEVLAEGSEEDLKTFLAFLHHGPRTAHVSRVLVQWSPAPAEAAPQPFRVKPTI